MSSIMEFLLITLEPAVFIYTVTNMFNMGIQANMDSVIAELKNKKAVALTFVWGWVLGPALAYLIAWVLRLDEPYVLGLLITSLAPVTAYLPLVVERRLPRSSASRTLSFVAQPFALPTRPRARPFVVRSRWP